MPSINVGESDFEAVAGAADDAKRKGRMADARTLDKLARKINLALSSEAVPRELRYLAAPHRAKKTWRDMPSTIGEP
jgi:hypothetical protein